MSHFASGAWNNPAGVVAQLSKDSVTAATGTSAAEGTDKLTYTTVREGLYRISLFAKVRTTGTGASQAVRGQVAYNHGAAQAAADILPFTGAATLTNLDLTSSTAILVQSGLVKANSGTAITITMLGSGTFTAAGIYDLRIVIEAV